MRYQYIKEMIYARVAGTAVNLSLTEDCIVTSQISYKKYRIWGIKTLVRFLVEDIFNTFYNSLPIKEISLNPEIDLSIPLKMICDRYNVSYETVLEFIEKRKEPRQIWQTMDNDLRAIFMINAFFEAFEKNLVDMYFIAISLAKPVYLNFQIRPKLKQLDFGLKDFGFVYRARGYASFFSKNVYNNGFSNTVKRLNQILNKEYIETFIEQPVIQDSGTNEQLYLADLSQEKKYVIEMLKYGNSNEKLEAIELILKNKIVEAVNELEYLLKNKDERVMNAALDAVISLKNLK